MMMEPRYYVEITSFYVVVRDRTVEVDDDKIVVIEDAPGVIQVWRHGHGVCRDADGDPTCAGHFVMEPESEEAAEKLCAELNAANVVEGASFCDMGTLFWED